MSGGGIGRENGGRAYKNKLPFGEKRGVSHFAMGNSIGSHLNGLLPKPDLINHAKVNLNKRYLVKFGLL